MNEKKVYTNVQVSDDTINGINSLIEQCNIQLKIVTINGNRHLYAINFLKSPNI